MYIAASQTTFAIPEINFLIPKISLKEENAFLDQKCHINATNDLSAIEVWLDKHKNNYKTYTTYRREAERLLLWCVQ